VDALRVVHEAIAASEMLAAPSLADLCAAAGVSQRWLHKCFVDVIGVSPHRCIKAARLSRARTALLAPEDRPLRIKSLALSLGYRLSGRFAADYRALFGENPSETFATSCKDWRRAVRSALGFMMHRPISYLSSWRHPLADDRSKGCAEISARAFRPLHNNDDGACG